MKTSREQMKIQQTVNERCAENRECISGSFGIDAAPMEGITTYAFRKVHHAYYNGVDRYYTPFLTANQTLHFQKREIREILPENNEGICLIPQVMTNQPDQMLWAVNQLAEYGYQKINFNLGCPYPTVVTRHKGAGFLEDPDRLDSFFEQVFDKLDPSIELTVKTRIGLQDTAEMEELMSIYNRYPIRELIVHPRLQKDMYTGSPDLQTFEWILENSILPVSYNGDILTVQDAEEISRRFPGIKGIMIGRGLLRDPALAERIREPEEDGDRGHYTFPEGKSQEREEKWMSAPLNSKEDLLRLRCYMQTQLESLDEYVSGDRNVISHIKELWVHVGKRLPVEEKLIRKLIHAGSMREYKEAENRIFSSIL